MKKFVQTSILFSLIIGSFSCSRFEALKENFEELTINRNLGDKDYTELFYEFGTKTPLVRKDDKDKKDKDEGIIWLDPRSKEGRKLNERALLASDEPEENNEPPGPTGCTRFSDMKLADNNINLFVDIGSPTLGDGSSFQSPYKSIYKALTDAWEMRERGKKGAINIYVAEGVYTRDTEVEFSKGNNTVSIENTNDPMIHLQGRGAVINDGVPSDIRDSNINFFGGYKAKDECVEDANSGVRGYTVIDAKSQKTGRYSLNIVKIEGNTSAVTFKKFIFKNGKANGVKVGDEKEGGGLFVYASKDNTISNINFEDCKFEDNKAEYSGGHLAFVTEGTGKIENFSMTGMEFKNSKSHKEGGAIYANGHIENLTIKGSIENAEVKEDLAIYAGDKYGGCASFVSEKGEITNLNVDLVGTGCKVAGDNSNGGGFAFRDMSGKGGQSLSGLTGTIIFDGANEQTAHKAGGIYFGDIIDMGFAKVSVKNARAKEGSAAIWFDGATTGGFIREYEIVSNECIEDGKNCAAAILFDKDAGKNVINIGGVVPRFVLGSAGKASVIKNNKSRNDFGGKYPSAVRIEGSNFSLTNGEVSENTSTTACGALLVEDGAKDIELDLLTIEKNTSDGVGAGLCVLKGSSVEISRSIFDANVNTTRSHGQAIYIKGDGADKPIVHISSGATIKNHKNGEKGAAIFAEDVDKLKIAHDTNQPVNIIGNKSTNEGGAVYLNNVHELEIDNIIFDNNKSENNDGGCLYATGYSENISITNTTFKNCKSTNKAGGAFIDVNANTNAEFAKNNFIGSDSQDHCGGFKIVNPNNRQLHINKFVCTNNNATGNGGCGCIESAGDVFINGGSFAQNSATEKGGALYVKLLANNLSFNSTFFAESNELNNKTSSFNNNTAKNGGALYVEDAAQITLTGTKLTNNNTTENGSAIFIGGIKNLQNISTDNYQNYAEIVGGKWTGRSRKEQKFTAENNVAQGIGAIYIQSQFANTNNPIELAGIFEQNKSHKGAAVLHVENFSGQSNVGSSVVKISAYLEKNESTNASLIDVRGYGDDIFTLMFDNSTIFNNKRTGNEHPNILPDNIGTVFSCKDGDNKINKIELASGKFGHDGIDDNTKPFHFMCDVQSFDVNQTNITNMKEGFLHAYALDNLNITSYSLWSNFKNYLSYILGGDTHSIDNDGKSYDKSDGKLYNGIVSKSKNPFLIEVLVGSANIKNYAIIGNDVGPVIKIDSSLGDINFENTIIAHNKGNGILVGDLGPHALRYVAIGDGNYHFYNLFQSFGKNGDDKDARGLFSKEYLKSTVEEKYNQKNYFSVPLMAVNKVEKYFGPITVNNYFSDYAGFLLASGTNNARLFELKDGWDLDLFNSYQTKEFKDEMTEEVKNEVDGRYKDDLLDFKDKIDGLSDLITELPVDEEYKDALAEYYINEGEIANVNDLEAYINTKLEQYENDRDNEISGNLTKIEALRQITYNIPQDSNYRGQPLIYNNSQPGILINKGKNISLNRIAYESGEIRLGGVDYNCPSAKKCLEIPAHTYIELE